MSVVQPPGYASQRSYMVYRPRRRRGRIEIEPRKRRRSRTLTLDSSTRRYGDLEIKTNKLTSESRMQGERWRDDGDYG